MTGKLLAIMVCLLLTGCAHRATRGGVRTNDEAVKSECGIPGQIPCDSINADPGILNIKWQRLIAEGETCPRCASTGSALDSAVLLLERSLAPLGIRIVVEKESLTVPEFKQDPLQSNRIWIRGRLLEDYVGGETGQSPCCEVCGPSDCRTVAVNGKTFEAIPASIIVQAGLIAASKLLDERNEAPCCGDGK